jgi:hypothetical protein
MPGLGSWVCELGIGRTGVKSKPVISRLALAEDNLLRLHSYV